MTKAQQARESRLLPNGIPRWIRCYDNRGESADRYTVVFTGRYLKTERWFEYLAMSAEPFHPQGIGQHGASQYAPLDTPNGSWPPALGRKNHLGWRIKFEDLPADCQHIVMRDYQEIWGLKVAG